MNGRTGENSLKRKLSGLERYFLRRPNANVIMVARVKGSVSPSQVSIAVSKARKKHPLLGAKLELDDRNIAWFTTKGVPNFEIEVRTRKSNDDWIQTVLEETNRYFPLYKGPLIHFTLVSSPEISELVINSHHTICDGMSLAYLIRDIMLYIGNPDLDVEINPFPPKIEEANFPPSSSLKSFYRVIIKFFNTIWDRKGITFDEDEYKVLHQTFWDENQHPAILAWELTEAQTSQFIAKCREKNISVHSALVTALHLARREIQNNAPPYLDTLSMTVNIRERLIPTVGEAVGVYFSSFRINLGYSQNKSFWEHACTTHQRIRQKLVDQKIFEVLQFFNHLHPSLVDSLYFSKYGLLKDKFATFFLKMLGDDKINTSLDVANLGRFDFSRDFGNIQLEAIYGPSQYVDFQEKYLGVLTVGGKMYCTFTFGEEVIDRDIIERIKEKAMDRLGKDCGW